MRAARVRSRQVTLAHCRLTLSPFGASASATARQPSSPRLFPAANARNRAREAVASEQIKGGVRLRLEAGTETGV
eukprot:6185814-Pleurochrysis_carterae.AAC.7